MLNKLYFFSISFAIICIPCWSSDNQLSKFANEYNTFIHKLDPNVPVDIASLLIFTDRIQSNFGRINKNTNIEIIDKIWENQRQWNALFKTMQEYEISSEIIRAAELFVLIPDTLLLEEDKKGVFHFCAIFTYCAQNNLISDILINAINNHTCNHQTNTFGYEDVLWQLPYLGTVIQTINQEIEEQIIEQNKDTLRLLRWYTLYLFFADSRSDFVELGQYNPFAIQNPEPITSKGAFMDIQKEKGFKSGELIDKFKDKPEICPDFEKRKNDFKKLDSIINDFFGENNNYARDASLLPAAYRNFLGAFQEQYNYFFNEEGSEEKKQEWLNSHTSQISVYLEELKLKNKEISDKREAMWLAAQEKLARERRFRYFKIILGLLGIGAFGGILWLYHHRINKN